MISRLFEERRFGTVRIPRDIIWGNAGIVQAIMSKMIVISASHDFIGEYIEYRAASWDFDYSPPGSIIPVYIAMIDDGVVSLGFAGMENTSKKWL